MSNVYVCGVQVDRESQTVVCDEELEDTSTEELRESLPEHQPRSKLVHLGSRAGPDPGHFVASGSRLYFSSS